MPDGNGNPLLRPGSEARWAEIHAGDRASQGGLDQTVEQRLMRGQRLSAQAAALRRAVSDARSDRP